MINWENFRKALEDFYRRNLGDNYSKFQDFNHSKHLSEPAWLDLNSNSFSLSTGNNIKGPGGILFDPEIGIVCFFLKYINESVTRKQIISAVSLRSKLQPGLPQNLSSQSEVEPEWRVYINWIVEEENQFVKWKETISDIRNNTAYFEEIGLDVLFLKNSNLNHDIFEHRLPKLLLNLRKIFKLTNPDQIYEWRSADELVIEMLKNLEDEMPEKIKPYCKELVDYGLDKKRNHITTNKLDQGYEKLGTFAVENFRNITNKIKLELGPLKLPKFNGASRTDAIAHIIYGPNGTGKTTLYEALEFSFIGCSERMLRFLKDTEHHRKNPTTYLDYLKPIKMPDTKPKITPDEESVGLIEIKCDKNPREESTASKLKSLQDVMLSQKRIGEFVHLDSGSFSAEVMKDYSPISIILKDYVANRFEKASLERKRLLTRLNMPTGFTIMQNTKEAYVTQLWQKSIPEISRNLLNVLEIFNQKENIPDVMRFNNIITNLNKLSKERKNVPTLEEAQDSKTWESFFSNFNKYIEELKRWHEKLHNFSKKWHRDKLLEGMIIWAEWLNQKKNKNYNGDILEEELLNELKNLENNRNIARKKGEMIKERLDGHFEMISSFLNNHWLPSFPDTCPTCNTDFKEIDGGLAAIIDNIKEELNKKRNQLRESYKDLSNRIKIVQKKLSNIGGAKFPLNNEEKESVMNMIDVLFPSEEVSIEDILLSTDKMDVIKQRYEELNKYVSLPELITEPNTLAIELAMKVKRELNNIDTIWESFDSWKSVDKLLNEKLSEIIKKHLPDTIGELWWEVTMCLTPSYWSETYTGLEIKVEDEKKSRLEISGKKALYIINTAEMNIIGISWLITRYILNGRWKYKFLVIDDPAQGMDEVSFGEFCRFMYTFLYLHQSNSIPLSLVLFLRQQEYSINAAKALYGVIHQLGWDDQSTPKLLKTMLLENGKLEITPLSKALLH